MTAWRSLQTGLPEGPTRGASGPDRFLRALLVDHDVDPGRSFVTDEEEEEREQRITRGFVGTETAGYAWEEEVCTYSSIFPNRWRLRTYGLPEIELAWDYTFEKNGQEGYNDFRNGTLRVRFSEPSGEARFLGVWEQVFGARPVLAPVGDP